MISSGTEECHVRRMSYNITLAVTYAKTKTENCKAYTKDNTQSPPKQ